MMALCTTCMVADHGFVHGHKSQLGLGILIVRGRWSPLENQCDTLSFVVCSTFDGRRSYVAVWIHIAVALMVGIIIRIH
jgi:hypothetical protein